MNSWQWRVHSLEQTAWVQMLVPPLASRQIQRNFLICKSRPRVPFHRDKLLHITHLNRNWPIALKKFIIFYSVREKFFSPSLENSVIHRSCWLEGNLHIDYHKRPSPGIPAGYPDRWIPVDHLVGSLLPQAPLHHGAKARASQPALWSSQRLHHHHPVTMAYYKKLWNSDTNPPALQCASEKALRVNWSSESDDERIFFFNSLTHGILGHG